MTQVERIAKLEKAVFGDGNGELGTIRKIDDLRRSVRFLIKLDWLILATILGALIKLLLTP